MRRIVVLGEAARVRGFRLAGATVLEADDAASIDRAWRGLPEDTVVVILTPAAAAVVGERLAERTRLTWAVMPG